MGKCHVPERQRYLIVCQLSRDPSVGTRPKGSVVQVRPTLAAILCDRRLGRHARKVGCDMRQVPEKRFVVSNRFIDESNSLPGPPIASVPRRIDGGRK